MKQNKVLAFDVYGTLINTSGICYLLKEICAEKADLMIEMWRNKQLEYSFRQTAMGIYKGFSYCTETALEYTCEYHKLVLTDKQKTNLLQAYNELPVFDDVKSSLTALKNDYELYAFSNGESENLQILLDYNKLTKYFNDVVSVEAQKQFKPSPKVYAHFNEHTNTRKENTYLVSSNSFDIIGAAYFGFKTIYLQRNEKSVLDPWGIEPDYVIKSLEEISTLIL
jgi:2-haloacid dehalogenase